MHVPSSHRLGFGEAKVQNTTSYDLCHDLLCLALFSKESIDMNKLGGCLSFQIHGHLEFPRSINDLPTFINLSALTTLLRVGDAFWRLCRRANDPSIITSRSTPTPSCLYEAISATKCSSRECSIRFEK
ncbi:hypothetical protein DM01DRAFT_351574 [Hesseltinella vesiculosa]|uniref:Uncharacterized protein n=1 Tax=Hesseltinella vesiculosa TaxID=101127 RepID=A0A1X2G6H0_9FUNG|nr:hypothetical protein DM01DRAFT_351574 [Hesseltinella vesiculosa]